MSSVVDGTSLRQVILGARVEQTAAALVQNAATALFTVAGGDVLVTAIYGKVSTVIGANAITVRLQYTKSGGSAVDLNAATTVTSDAVGTLYTPTYDPVDTFSVQSLGGADVPSVTFANVGLNGRGWILPAGAMTLLSSNADPDGGKITWTLFYVPLASGASVSAT